MCLEHCGALFANDIVKRLAIVNYPQAKYYAVYTEQELETALTEEPELGQRIVINGTHKEFLIICQSDQYSLFPKAPDGDT